jgi:ribosomal protein L22
MTPDKPENPQQGTPDESKVAEEAKQAKATNAAEAEAEAQPEPKPKRTRARSRTSEPKAEEQAAAETGVDKEAAEATGQRAGRKRDRRRTPQPGVLVHAKARYVRTSARKARLVCDHIRGKDVAEARAILAFTPRAAAKPWLKLLESAVANAEHNHELVGEELRIAAVHADEGPTLKRFRPRAMGRATRIRKRTSHLSITLTPKES